MRNFKNRKHTIRATAVLMLSVLMLFATATMTFAKSSINDNSNKPYVPGSGEWTSGGFEYNDDWNGIISVDVEPGNYQNGDVRDVVIDINNGKDFSFDEIIKKTHQTGDKTDASNFPTTDGYNINLNMYDRITDFYELRDHRNGANYYIKPGVVTISIPEAKGMRGSDLMIMVIDSKTGEIYLVPPIKFNSLLGIMTVDFPCLGPYCVLHRIPIVVRNVDPDRYPNKELADIIRKMPSNEAIECLEFMKATGVENYKKLKVAEDKTVNTKDYSSAIALSDIAVDLPGDDFSYDMSAKFRANIYRGNDKVDWERILKYSDIEYDKENIEADNTELTEIEPFTLEDSFVYHIDASTREVSIIYEPTICWSTFGELHKDADEEIGKDDILYWDVDDIEEDSDDVCIVINGDEYLGMGPFLLFMPKHADGFPWWILIIIAIIVVGTIIWRTRKS